MPWYAIQVKDFYNSPSQYKKLAELLRGPRYNKKDSEFHVPGNGEESNCYCTYVLIKEKGDFFELWDMLSREKYINPADGFLQLSDRDAHSIINFVPEVSSHKLVYGDLVKITNGTYDKLYGIILKESKKGVYEVGMKIFIGTRIAEIAERDLTFVRSVFESWKFKV